MNDIQVSICCITYNQEKYIEKAIKSFLEQKTNFKYEIIIHDDASTDNTAKIIKKYQMLYPDIIKPIYQKENQYSKGKKASLITFKKATGKYIAFCEGDDYWTDINKLQIQYNYMEKHKKCSLTFHNAYSVNLITGERYKMMKLTRRYYKFFQKYDVGDLAKLDFIPTASMFFRRDDIDKLPEFYNNAIVGDLPLRLLLTSYGYSYYCNRIMSVYVRGTGNSAVDKFNKEKNKNIDNAINYLEKKQDILKNINIYTNNKYAKDIQVAWDRIESDKLMYKEDYKGILKKLNVFWASPRKRMIKVLKLNFLRYKSKEK